MQTRGFDLIRQVAWVLVSVIAAATLSAVIADAAEGPVSYTWEGVVTDGLAPGDAIRGTITFPGEDTNPNQSDVPSFQAFYFTSTVDVGGEHYEAPYLGGWIVGEGGQLNQDLVVLGDKGTDARFNYEFRYSEPDTSLSYGDVERLDSADVRGSWYMQAGNHQYSGTVLKIARVLGAPEGNTSGGGDSAPVPEPSSLALLSSGLVAFGVWRKRK